MKKMDGPHFQILIREQLIMQKFTTSMHLHNIRFSSPNVISMDICNTSSHNWTISNFSRSTNILTSLIFCCAIKNYIIKVDMIMWGMLKVWPISWIIDFSSTGVCFTSLHFTSLHFTQTSVSWKTDIPIYIYLESDSLAEAHFRNIQNISPIFPSMHICW